METNTQKAQNIEIVPKKEVSLRKLLNVIGIFIFGGLALTIVTNPLPSSDYTIEFLLFIVGSTVIYYVLVSLYFIGGLWRVMFYGSLLILIGFSLFMVFYIATHSTTH